MKRKLKAQAKKAEKEILARNSDFYNEIMEQYYPEQTKEKSKRKLIIKVSSIVTACILFIVSLSVVLFKFFKNEEVEYLYENEVGENTDMETLYKAVPWFPKLNEQDYDYKLSRTYDSVSGDNLYFAINIKGNSFAETIKVYLYINPYYKERLYELSRDVVNNVTVNKIPVNYKETVKQEDGIFTFEYIAQYSHGKNEVYIEYKQLWFENDTHFFKFLEEIVS